VEAATLDARREARARWRRKNPQYGTEWSRERRRDPEFRRAESAKSRRWQLANPIKNAILQYRASAKRKGHEFALGVDDVERMVTGDCFYCGVGADPINGIDRVDNAVGYVIGNVVTACRRCNIAKLNMSIGDFGDWVGRLVAHSQKWRR
jgi:hypothetical protein